MERNVNVVDNQVIIEKSKTKSEELIQSVRDLEKIKKNIVRKKKEIDDLEVLAFEKQEEIQNISTQLI